MSRCIFLLNSYYGFILVLCRNNQTEQFSFVSGLRQVKKLNFVSHCAEYLSKPFSGYPLITFARIIVEKFACYFLLSIRKRRVEQSNLAITNQ